MSSDKPIEPEPIITCRHIGMSYNIRARRLKKEFHARPALEDVSFDLYAGETIGVIGRNGAGKSTLLRVLARIMQPDTGELIISPSTTVRLLGLSLGFLQDLSGWDNLILGGLMLGMSRKAIRSKMDQIIAFAELEQCIHNPLRTYSSGMQARLAFSLAVTVPSKVLLIDELMGVGDAQFQNKSNQKLNEMIHSNISVVLVSHSAETIENNCSRVVWIEEGKTVKVGPTREILEEYKRVMLNDSEARRL